MSDVELRLLAGLQAAMPEATLPAWRLASDLGSSTALLIAIAMLAWLYHTRRALAITLMLALSGLIGGALKLVFRAPRPWMLSDGIQPLTETGGYGMPSGHALSAAVFFGMLALFWRRYHDGSRLGAVAWCLPAVVIGVSRAVLGVHSPTQILAGWSLGLVVVACFAWLERHDGEPSATPRIVADWYIGVPVVLLPLLAVAYYALLDSVLPGSEIPAAWGARWQHVYGTSLTHESLSGAARLYLFGLLGGCLLARVLDRQAPEANGPFLSIAERIVTALLGALVLSTVATLVVAMQPRHAAVQAVLFAVSTWVFFGTRWLVRRLAWRWL